MKSCIKIVSYLLLIFFITGCQWFKGVSKKSEEKKLVKSSTEQKGTKMKADDKTDNQKFLQENKSKEGVKTTASGLQYKVLKEGKGDKPKASDTVEVHYRGQLIDGKEFDSSYKRNQSISFPLNGVIAGWTEGLQLMKEGAKYILYIPSNLGYGERGAGASIPPDAALIFEVELIKIKK